MVVQALPILKAVLPYLGPIADAVIPVFTAKKSAEAARNDPVIARQIEELQAAATQNAQLIRVLAEQLQQAMQGIETAAEDARKQVAAYKTMLYVALGLAGLSMLLLIRPDEVLSGVPHAVILEVAHDPFWSVLQHRHMVIGCLA